LVPTSGPAELELVADRLDDAGKGIILFHDIRARTPAMLPAFPWYVRDNGHHIVHVIPAEPAAAGHH